MNKTTLYFLLLLLASSCHRNDSEPAKRAVEFLSWYEDNGEELRAFPVWEFDTILKTRRINYETTEKCLAFLQSSGTISDTFLQSMRDYFKELGTPVDFLISHDYVEPEVTGPTILMLYGPHNYIDDTYGHKVVEEMINQEKALIVLEFNPGGKLKFILSKKDGEWYIDNIEVPEVDL